MTKRLEPSVNRMYERRRQLHLTQAQAGEMIGISTHQYSYYETGKNIPGVQAALNIATAFGTTVEYLFGVGAEYKVKPRRRKSREHYIDFIG